MFQRWIDAVGHVVERRWRAILLAWLMALCVSIGVSMGLAKQLGLPIPWFKEVAEDGEFAYLPHDMQSLRGEALLAKAFPQDLLNSSVVIVVRRTAVPLVEADEQFIETVLKPRLEALIAKQPEGLVASLRTARDPLMGKLLVSKDGRASLVIVALTSEFLEWGNRPLISAVENLILELPTEFDPQTRQPVVPSGLDLALSGTATVGRDMLVANQRSARATELWTTLLVVGLLLAIYRAPLLALIPLLTVFSAVHISLLIVTQLTQLPFFEFRVFMGLEVYITVVVYGAGVDYCLFLIARYKEELDLGVGLPEAIPTTISRVGAALVASAGTVICGIGMMVFAQFGKFREAGIGISLSLCVVLLAAMTLTPALLRLTGRWAFWPFGRDEHIAGTGRFSGTRFVARLIEHNRIHVAWERMGRFLVRYPARILATCFLAMLPFAVLGLAWHDYLSYGLLSELQPTNQSVIGAKAVQNHFPAGNAGPLTVLLRHDQLDFRDSAGRTALDQVVDHLRSHRRDLGLADIRYLTHPLGLEFASIFDDSTDVDSSSTVSVVAARVRARRRELERRQALEYYVSSAENYDGHVTRLDLIFETDPFSRESINQLNAVEQAIRETLPEELRTSAELLFVGATASIRDLKTVTDHDQVKIDMLVLASVFLILLLLLRKPAISLYLILSVFFSYFVTLGVTFALFYWLDPANFAGLDWKVPMFLFTILIAVGEDYNIFLMTRIEEEQGRFGAIEGVRVAMLKTGSIISSCGIIMAGTFFSLILGGALVGMQQLGFALAFGVLLDTFVVRPLLVPAYLVLLYSGRFGSWGRLLGERHAESPSRETVEVHSDRSQRDLV